MRLLVQIGLVALGSSLGGLMRWGVGIAAARWIGSALPYGTFFINVSGSLFLGWFLTVLADKVVSHQSTWLRAEDLRMLFAVGFAGSYTTFSTFEWESNCLLRDGQGFAGATYILGSVLIGLIAIRAGILLARLM